MVVGAAGMLYDWVQEAFGNKSTKKMGQNALIGSAGGVFNHGGMMQTEHVIGAEWALTLSSTPSVATSQLSVLPLPSNQIGLY